MLNSILYIPKTQTGCNWVSGSFATILLSAFEREGVKLLKIQKAEQTDKIQILYNGINKTITVSGKDSVNSILKKIKK